MTPMDPQIEIMGGSSDHTILDVTHCDREYKVGDIVSFKLGYGGMLKAATGPVVCGGNMSAIQIPGCHLSSADGFEVMGRNAVSTALTSPFSPGIRGGKGEGHRSGRMRLPFGA